MRLSDVLQEISDGFKNDEAPRSALNFKTLSDQARAMEDKLEKIEKLQRYKKKDSDNLNDGPI